jgi:endonuclease I
MKKSLSIISFFYFLSLSVFGAIPLGYYDSAIGKSTAALKTELHNILCRDTTHYLGYGSGAGKTWEGFNSTDRDTVTNEVIDMYSANARYFPNPNLNFVSFGTTVEIEHSLPKSWWKCDINHPDCPAKDLNHLYPADGPTNSSKNDDPLGVVTGTPTKNNGVSKIGPGSSYTGYVGAVFEPADQYKGDFARSYFYMVTAYEHYAAKWDTSKPENMLDNNTYPVLKPGAIELLLQWHRQDPVSDKERIRTNVVYKIQRNRNPFIDHPELIEYIWGIHKGEPWSIVAGIDDAKIKFSITPNPVQNIMSVHSDEENLSYSVYNVTGQLLMEDHLNANKSITVNQLNNGIYILQLKSGSRKTIEKFIVNK